MIKNRDSNGVSGLCTAEVVPGAGEERRKLIKIVREYIEFSGSVPPVSEGKLREIAAHIIRENKLPENLNNYIMVLAGNELWRDIVSSIPYSRRILLLPQCLRDKDLCPAQMDAFGLLCEECGQCITGVIQKEAEKAGYYVIVAEGTTMVTRMLEDGAVDCVIGVSCISALERSFPYTASSSIPAIGIPLLKDGCNCCEVDHEELLDFLREPVKKKDFFHINFKDLQSDVKGIFKESTLGKFFSRSNPVEKIAFEWMLAGGKRWRPLLCAGVFRAVRGSAEDMDNNILKTAIAIECFHKASLIHDDIEDSDDFRYDKPSLHKQYNIPVALNIGDYLIGKGYELLSELDFDPEIKADLFSVASSCHCALCTGQGLELNKDLIDRELSEEEVLDIFNKKTSPAFEVALLMGAVLAGRKDLGEILKDFSSHLGVAYQIQDDIEDLTETGLKNLKRDEISIVKIIADKLGYDDEKSVEDEAVELKEKYRDMALASLEKIQIYSLKSFLFRILFKAVRRNSEIVVHRERDNV